MKAVLRPYRTDKPISKYMKEKFTSIILTAKSLLLASKFTVDSSNDSSNKLNTPEYIVELAREYITERILHKMGGTQLEYLMKCGYEIVVYCDKNYDVHFEVRSMNKAYRNIHDIIVLLGNIWRRTAGE